MGRFAAERRRALDAAARAWRCAFVIEFPLARQRFER
jgi:hypothetical protein